MRLFCAHLHLQGRAPLLERYLVAYQYGAVILFNFSQEQQQEALDVIASLATHPFKATFKDGEWGSPGFLSLSSVAHLSSSEVPCMP